MAGRLQLEVATPDRLVFSGEVDFVTAVGGLGEFTVLPNHSPLLTTIVPGVLRFGTGSEVRKFAVGWGYAEVRPYKVLMLVEFAVGRDEIDPKSLEEEINETYNKANNPALPEEEREVYRKQLERLKAKKKLVAA